MHQVTVAHVAPPLINFMAKHPAVESVLPLPALTELFSGTVTQMSIDGNVNKSEFFMDRFGVGTAI